MSVFGQLIVTFPEVRVSVVFHSGMHLVLGNGRELNSKGSEISVVQQLIEALDIRGVTFTLYEQIEKTTAEETQIHSRYSQIELNKKKV